MAVTTTMPATVALGEIGDTFTEDGNTVIGANSGQIIFNYDDSIVSVSYDFLGTSLTIQPGSGFGNRSYAQTIALTVTAVGVGATTISVSADGVNSFSTEVLVGAPVDDESYLNKRGLAHFWENIDSIKQDKLTAGTNITISANSTISATQPTVNNGTLTIQKNGANVQTFTANQSANATANITVPTATSDLTNDSGFLTSIPTASASTLGGIKVGSGLSISNGVLSAQSTAPDWSDITNKPTFATVATSGSYNDLTNKPTIPTVNNGTLTIQKNGTNVQTFTANQSGNATANITVPTAVSELNNDSGYQTAAQVQTAVEAKQDELTAGDHIDITNDVISATGYVHSDDPVTTTSSTATVTGSMIANGTITADKLATGATLKLTLSTTDIGEGAALAANTLYGVYQ